jgi:PatG C-terminal/Subtilase family/PatG Domain
MADFYDTSGLQDLWQKTLGDSGICIAILDSPIEVSHPCFIGASLTYSENLLVERERNFGALRHGTHVASIVFAQHHLTPVKGIAPLCRGIVIPIFHSADGRCSQKDLAEAIDRAVAAGAHVINISAGELSLSGTAHPTLAEAVMRCTAAGTLIVAAAGNQGCDCLQIPGALPLVLAVGAMDAHGDPLECSNWGEAYQTQGILAPGDRILGATPGGGIALSSGTSFAAAIVSGVAGLLLSLQKQAGRIPNPLEIRKVLLDTASKVVGDSPRTLTGRLNLVGAVDALLESSPLQDEKAWTPLATLMQGEYIPRQSALQDEYKNLPLEKFGTVDVQLPDGSAYNVRDLHYAIGATSGMRLLPVNDEGGIVLPSGTIVAGHFLIDDFLRREMGLTVSDPIYALVSYIRPEEHTLPISQLVHSYKLKLGHQHLAAYLGEGNTTHALAQDPEDAWKVVGRYMVWNVKGRPANVHLVSLQGVDQATLNRNFCLVDTILAAGARSPEDTQNITCRTIDLNTTLQFYRDWIRDSEYLEDIAWYTNCSNHKTIVVNVALNLPHNLLMFEEVFGEDGKQLWLDFQQKYTTLTKQDFSPPYETHFKPLWQLEGLSVESICPLTLADYNRFQAAKLENRLDRFNGPRPLPPGKGMAWKLETLADLIAGLIGIYVSFLDVGGVIPSLMLLRFQAQVQHRIGIPEDHYWNLVAPIVSQFLLADARVNAKQDMSWLERTAARLHTTLGSDPTDMQPGHKPNVDLAGRVESLLEPASEQLERIRQNVPMSRLEALFWLKQAILPEIDNARRLATTDASKAGFFSSPGIFQSISQSMYEKSHFVQIRTVCTVMDHSELQRRPFVNPVEHQNHKKEFIDMSEENVQFSQDSKPTFPNGTIVPSAVESSACDCAGAANAGQLVYALGKLYYDLVSQSRRDSIQQQMGESANPELPQQLLTYLDANSWDASAIQWTLMLDSTPIYVIQPQGAFAKETYDLLRRYLREQYSEGVEHISIPGIVSGTAKLRSGYVVPVVVPEIRGMYSWTTNALLSALGGTRPEPEAEQAERDAYDRIQEGVNDFLDRVYFELRNLGQKPQERAINFAATNAFQIAGVYESAMREDMDLDSIDVERSPIGRPGTDCWDVKIVFFFPQRQVQTVRKVYRFTVDVTDVVPVTVGQVRSWFIR